MSMQEVLFLVSGMCMSWTSVHQGQNLERGVASVLVAAGLEVPRVVVLAMAVVLGPVAMLGVVVVLVGMALGTPAVTVTMAVCVTTNVPVLSEEDVAVEVIVGLSGGGLGAGKACTPIARIKHAKVVNLERSWHNIVSGVLAKHECQNLQGHAK